MNTTQREESPTSAASANTVSIALRLPENAAALEQLVQRRLTLLSLIMDKGLMGNVPAGSADGGSFLLQAIEQLNLAIASLIHADLVYGKRWNG